MDQWRLSIIQEIAAGKCCYSMCEETILITFWEQEFLLQKAMPVHFVPRTEACSSILIRIMYHAKDERTPRKAALAKTRHDGKPVDEQGNVLKLVLH